MENAGQITVTLASVEKHYGYDRLGVEFNSTDAEILNALAPVLQEEEGFDIRQEQAEGHYTIKRTTDPDTGAQNVYVFPKSIAG